jgi:hypothetical protein
VDLNAHFAKRIDGHCFKSYPQRLKHEKDKRASSVPIAENHEVAARVNDTGNEEREKESDAR